MTSIIPFLLTLGRGAQNHEIFVDSLLAAVLTLLSPGLTNEGPEAVVLELVCAEKNRQLGGFHHLLNCFNVVTLISHKGLVTNSILFC